MPPTKRIEALNAALTDGTQIIRDLTMEHNRLLRDNSALRVKLIQAMEHLQTSRAHAMELAKELEKYQKSEP